MQSKVITFVSEWQILTEVNINLSALLKLLRSSVEHNKLLQWAAVSNSLSGDRTSFLNANGIPVDTPTFYLPSQ